MSWDIRHNLFFNHARKDRKVKKVFLILMALVLATGAVTLTVGCDDTKSTKK